MGTISLAEAKKSPWFHSIDFTEKVDYVSKTRFGANVPPNYTLFGFYDLIRYVQLDGCDCLDIGTMDGIAAFIMKRLGASRVVASDIGTRKTFLFAREMLGLDVDYVTDTDLYNIQTRTDRKFDVTLMAGVLYHVFDPLYAITVARQITKTNGFALIETHFLKDETRPIMLFNPADENPIEQENFFWRASASCLEGMFSLCGFKVIARRDVGKRTTYLLQAVRPSELSDAGTMTKRIHERFMTYRHYRENINFAALESDQDFSTAKLISTPTPVEAINVKQYAPSVPLQPRWADNTARIRMPSPFRLFRKKSADGDL